MLRVLALGKWSKEEKQWSKVIDLQSAARMRLGPKRARPIRRPRPTK
jgi:hypothetical protein